MRTSFSGIMKDEQNANIILGNEANKQKESLEAAIARRNKGLKKEVKKKPEVKEEEDDDGDASVIQDNYGDLVINTESKPKILDDDFMGELKLAEVPDSDDECYF